jgi:lipopolysaccharide exporter
MQDILSDKTSNQGPRWMKRLLTPGDRLSQRVMHAGFWAFMLRIADRLIGLAQMVVLARLLAPEDFGLFGIALLALSVLETFSQTGFNAALIQKRGDILPYLDTAWTVQAIRGFVLAAILLAIAPSVAAFFGEPGAAPLVQALALYQVFSGLVNTGVLYFRKELEFHKEFLYMFSGTLVNLAVAIPAALILRNAWALIFGLIAGQFVRMIVSYLVHPYRPSPRFNRAQNKELSGFGMWVLGSSALVFLVTQGDSILVGKLLGATALGYYQMAYKISNIPATEITNVISLVSYPAYSKLQDKLDRLREAYMQVLQVTAFISFPVAGLILVLAPEFTAIFLGENWMPIVPAMQVLALAGLARSIAATSGYLFYAIGKPKIDTLWQIARLVVITALIYPFTLEWGFIGASIAVFLSIFISSIGFCHTAMKLTKHDKKTFLNAITYPLISSTIAVLLISGSKSIIGEGPKEFVLMIFIGILAYSIVIYLSDRFFDYKIKDNLREIKRSFGGG